MTGREQGLPSSVEATVKASNPCGACVVIADGTAYCCDLGAGHDGPHQTVVPAGQMMRYIEAPTMSLSVEDGDA